MKTAKLTLFIPLMEGLFDSDYGPHAYEGHLDRDAVLEIGTQLGDCYARAAIEGTKDDGWCVTYHSEDVEPNKHENGENYAEIPGCGALSYVVEYREVRLYPIPG